jgi:peptidyl-prolyl cis-trans isomerase A (cyclophilin A)
MIQGGDPAGTGMGGTDVIADEFNPSLKFDQPGRLAMANAGLHTGSCQFFITDALTPHLNGKHTIFGQVVEHQDVVGQIARVPKDRSDKPDVPVVIKKVTFERWKDGKEAPVFAPAATKAGAAKKSAGTAAKKTTAAPAK